MPKASSPVRLQAELMDSANLAGTLNNRSAAEQVEHWASIGRHVAQQLTQADLLELKAGLLSVSVEKPSSVDFDADALLDEIDVARDGGTLSEAIKAGGPRYQIASNAPGWLERVEPDGSVTVGRFEGGVFKART